MLRRYPGPCHDGHRCGQAQGAGAGNDQHRHGIDQRLLKGMAREPPAQHRSQCNDQHHGHKHCTHLVHQALNGRLGRLRVFHQANDAGEHGLAAHSTDLHHHAPIPVNGAPREHGLRLRASMFLYRQRFAREHRFIHLGVAFQQQAVHREPLAGLDHQSVTHQHFGHGHVHFAVRPHQVGRVRPQRMQGPNGRGGLALGAGFQPLAQHHQRDHQGRAFKIQMHHVPRLGREP